MRTVSLAAVALLLISGLTAGVASAQDLHPSRRPSPLGMARGFAGDVYVKVTYSRPYKRGRDNIFGEPGTDVMHPYGEVWRFGANEPTEITFSGPVLFGGQRIEAGTYSIFATPGKETWTLHVNDLRGGGANQYDASRNVANVTVDVMPLEEEVDQFTIELEEDGEGLRMTAMWLNWKLEVPIRPAG